MKKLASAIGIALNLLLGAGKLALGMIFGMVSIVADGFNNLSDCGSQIVTLVSLHIADKPADAQHPFGHRRAEYLSALITGCFVLFLAVELLRESIGTIVGGGSFSAHWAVFAVLGVSIGVKLAMFVFFRLVARKTSSDALRAAALDSLMDCLSTAAVLGGVGLGIAGVNADGWIGVLVAGFIIWQGVRLLMDASSKLLGQADPALTAELCACLEAADILGFHDLHVYTYGKGAAFATVHVEMDASLSALSAHAVIDAIEYEVQNKTGVKLTVHLDPVDLADRAMLDLEQKIEEESRGLTRGLKFHDFRLVRGTENKVIFEAGVPFSCPLKDAEIKKRLEEIVRAMGDYTPIVTIERE